MWVIFESQIMIADVIKAVSPPEVCHYLRSVKVHANRFTECTIPTIGTHAIPLMTIVCYVLHRLCSGIKHLYQRSCIGNSKKTSIIVHDIPLVEAITQGILIPCPDPRGYSYSSARDIWR